MVGVRSRAVLSAMIHEKGISLSSQARHHHTTGEVINLINIDVECVKECSWYMHDFWMAPVQVSLSLVILSLGLISLDALVVIIVISLLRLLP